MEHLNDTHRGFPRTLEQAFGPHCRKVIEESEPPAVSLRTIALGIAVAALVLLIFAAVSR